MESYIYYASKNLARKRKEGGEKLLLKKILEYGPWRFDLNKMEGAKLSNPDFLQIENMEKFLLPVDDWIAFEYVLLDNMIFVLWDEPLDGDESYDLNYLKDDYNRRLAEISRYFSTNLPDIKPEFSLADYADIKKYQSELIKNFPLQDNNLLLCKGQCCTLMGKFNVYSSSRYNTDYIICSAKLPNLDSFESTESAESADHEAFLLNADYRRASLRPLPKALLTDNTLGHWDLYWPEGTEAPADYYEKTALAKPLQRRNPAADIVDGSVAIDFGTSSTVVAVNYKGKTHLVRIGEDSNENAEDSQRNPFENPTVLQFENGRNLMEIWQNEPFRPAISINDAVCSHQARQEINSHVKSTMINLKTWARKCPADPPLILTDVNNAELSFIPSDHPCSIDIEKDFQSSPLDPIELYAYYLGLQLNNQLVDGGRIFTNYYMTFPVMFEDNVKKRIMASFRRGIARSLPPSLIYACGFDAGKINITEIANEPAAFAAAALPALKNRKTNPPETVSKTHLEAKLSELYDWLGPRPWNKPYESFSKEELAGEAEWLNIEADKDFESLSKYKDEIWQDFGFIQNILREKYPAAYEKFMRFIDSFSEYYSFRIIDKLQYSIHAYAETDAAHKTSEEEAKKFILQIYHYHTFLHTAQIVHELCELIKKTDSLDSVRETPRKPPLPTAAGTAFGVFDFGGGTADYAIGLYRLPTEQEQEEEIWETVLDILAVSGDPDLGGEHLVHQLAFEVACANKELLIEKHIPFIRPENSDYISGTEKLFYQGGIALSNTRKLMEKLRPLWETGALELEGGQISETFESNTGEQSSQIKLNIDLPALRQILKQRISRAVDEFFILFGQSFSKAGINDVDEFHIILAGNSCRSPLVRECFSEKAREIANTGDMPEKGQIIIHPPLLADAANPEAVSMKTGVALGLLNTLDWEPTGVILRKADKANTPFPYTVGSFSQGFLKPVLKRDCAYNKWEEFGICKRQGAFLALYTQSPQGMEGTLPRSECHELKVNFGEGHMGQKILACAKSPKIISFALQKKDGKPELEQEFKLS